MDAQPVPSPGGQAQVNVEFSRKAVDTFAALDRTMHKLSERLGEIEETLEELDETADTVRQVQVALFWQFRVFVLALEILGKENVEMEKLGLADLAHAIVLATGDVEEEKAKATEADETEEVEEGEGEEEPA
jgi:hypothetical protein